MRRLSGAPRLLRSPGPRIVGLEKVEGGGARLHRDAITDVDCAKGVVASSSRDGSLKITAFKSGDAYLTPRRSLSSTSALACVTLTPDAARAVTGGLDSSLSIFDVEAGSMVLRVADAHDAAIAASALCSADTIATAALDASVKLWHLGGAACDEVVAFYDHESPATCVAARGNLVVAGADDGRVLVWDARDAGAPVGAAILPSPVTAIALESSPSSGDAVFALATDGSLHHVSIDGRVLHTAPAFAAATARSGATALAVFDSRPDSLARGRSTAGPYACAANRDGDLVLLDWQANGKAIARKRKAHGAAITTVVPVFDDVQTDLEACVISVADDCTLQAWTVVRDDLAI